MEKTIPCPTCPKKFQHDDLLKWHRKKCTGLVFINAFQCEHCKDTFSSRGALANHTSVSHDGFIYACDVCDKRFKYDRSLRQHKEIYHTGSYVCKECGLECVNQFVYKRHVEIHDPDFEEKLRCAQCGKKCTSIRTLQNHSRTHDPHYVHKKFVCEKCGKGFRKRYEILEHERLHAAGNEFACEKCGKVFVTKRELSLHSSFHPNDKYLFVCKFCDKGFNSKLPYNDHLRTHTGKKPFECPDCDKSYGSKIALKTHYKQHHTEHVEFECGLCLKTFKSKLGFTLHTRKKHGVPEEDSLVGNRDDIEVESGKQLNAVEIRFACNKIGSD